ncbi:5,6-dimethylbenzimidazole synthase, partial [Streptomyces somaliensis DSM 40738]|nr:5,6-dimethylbenzimidazole synthase [Streptomyces somaliensis DSM 40738]
GDAAPVYERSPHGTGAHGEAPASGTDGRGSVHAPWAAPAPVPQQTPRRPLHMGPPMPDTGGVVRSLADRGPAPAPSVPAPVQGAPAPGSGYPDVSGTVVQGAQPWPQRPAEAEAAVPEAGGSVPAEDAVPAAPHPVPAPWGEDGA